MPRVAEKFEPSRPTSEVSALSAEVEVSRSSEAEPSAAPEAPLMLEIVVPSPSSSEMKTSEAGQSDGASAQPSARADGGWNQVVRVESESVVPHAESKYLTGASQPQSANPEPTAVDRCSSQVEGGALSSLGCRWTQLRLQGSASTGTIPSRLSCTPEATYLSLSGDGAGSTLLRPEQIPIQWLRAVPEVAGVEGLDHVQLPEMSEAEMITFGRSQAERWMSSPPGVVNPIDVAYAPCRNGHGLWEFIRAASATARHLMRVTRSPSARWLNVFKDERRRIPLVSNLKAARVSLRLIPPIGCVSILQTMLHETRYEFLNQVPEWHTLSELSSVPEAQIRLEIERIGNFIESELVAWNTAVELTTSYVRPLSDSLLLAFAQTAESQVGFPLNKDDDDIVDEVTQLLLGADVVLRLWLTGLGARGSVSRIQDESSGKRQLLSAGCVIPKGRDSIESVSETRRDFAKIPGHSMASVGPSSDTSLMVTDNGVNLCGLSSSGSSLMSVPDITVGTRTHLSISAATVVREAGTGMTQGSFQGMAISVTPPVSSTSVWTGTGTFRPEHLVQVSPPGTPESKRRDEQNVEVAETRPTHPGYYGGRPDSDRFVSSGTSAEVLSFDQQYRCDLTRSDAKTWVHFDADQSRRIATEVRLNAALADSRDESAIFREEYLKCEAASTQLSEAQQNADVDYWKQVGDLEKGVERYVAEAAEMRKADEILAKCYLGALKELQEDEDRAKQAELQRVHNERAVQIRAEYDVELLRLKEEHAQAQAAHEQAVAEREEKLPQLQSAQEQLNTQADSRFQMSHSTGLLNPARVPTEPLRVSTVNDDVLVKLDQLIDDMYHMVQANQRQAEPVEPRDKITTAQNSSKNKRTKYSARIPASASRRSSKACTLRSKTPDDNDWGSGSSSSSDSSQDELEGQFGATAQTKSSDAGLGTRAVVQAIVPRDALGKFDEQGSLDNRVDWWERFKYYATMMPWDEKTRIVQLRMRLSGSLKDWCAQLHDSTRSDWKKLSHVFKKEWCRGIDSKAESFYSMEMHYAETILRLAGSSDSEKPIDLVREPVRDRSKFQALCAFAYVGPALPCWCDDNSKCMSSASQASDYPSLTEVEDSSSELEFENNVEFALTYGDRYGWWSDHVLVGGKRDTAMVHVAIFNRRTQIWMDTGAMTSIMSLDFARKLKLKLRRGYRLRVSGFGDAPKYATAKATIMLTLGVGVIYVMDIWVGNIGAGLDCLLGMDFMIAAGVRLCARKGVFRLPDEESLFLVGGIELEHVGLEIDVSPAETVRLQPGRSVILPVKYHQAEPDKTVAWAGRGDQWVTQFIYGSGRKPKAVKVVNISDQVARITQHTVVACLVENAHSPQGKCFVRPWSRKYREWSALVYAAEPSTEYLRLEELVARQAELRGPPAVERPTYAWPKKLLLAKRPSKKDDVQSAGPESKVSVYMVNTNPPAQPKNMLSQGRHTACTPTSDTS